MTILRDATPADLKYIDSLRKKESNALGFIPLGCYESIVGKFPVGGKYRYLYSRLLVTEDDGDLTGFCYATLSKPKAHIFQIVVQEDARRWQRAILMENAIEQDAIRRANTHLTCRVAYDLESNFFWRAIGFTVIAKTVSTWMNQKESQCKRPLIVYEKQLAASLFDLNAVLAYQA